MPTGIYRVELTSLGWALEFAGAGGDPFGAGATNPTSYQRQFGIIQRGIELPDPEYRWEPFYGVGVLDRNWITNLKGRQELRGRVPEIWIAHDTSRDIFRLIWGLSFSNAVAQTDDGTPNTSITAATGTFDDIDLGSFTSFKPASNNVRPTHIIMSKRTASAADLVINDVNDWSWAYIGAGGAAPIINTFMDYGYNKPGWNGVQPPNSGAWEVRALNEGTFTSNLLDDYAGTVDHRIREALLLPSFSLSTRFGAVDGETFIREYRGCKVNSATFSASEESKLIASLDFITQDMRWNVGSAALATRAWQKLNSVTAPATTFKFEQPYVFSEATLSFFGTTFARIKNFSLRIDNNLDPRYYISNSAAALSPDNQQILTDLIEGRRVYELEVTIDVDDTSTDLAFLREMLRQGHADGATEGAFTGFTVSIAFERGTSTSDTMTFTMPSVTPTASSLGCFFGSVPHSIGTPTDDLQEARARIIVPSCRVDFLDA
mgnify:CR=1 FL=1